MSDTPETDAQASLTGAGGLPSWHVHSDFCRKLERKNNRALELLEDYERDKRQIGKDLGLTESEQLVHRFQRRAIFDLQREKKAMKEAMAKINQIMHAPASNRTFMQVAGPARQVMNITNKFSTKP